MAQTLTAWASRYLDMESDDKVTAADRPSVDGGEVVVTEKNRKFLRGLYSHRHELLADEPVSFGGSDQGPTPYDYLLMALGSCSSMTMRMYANHKKLAMEDVTIRLRHEKIHARDCVDCEKTDGYIDRIHRQIHIDGDLSDAERTRLVEIADRCPVHRTLENHPEIITQLED